MMKISLTVGTAILIILCLFIGCNKTIELEPSQESELIVDTSDTPDTEDLPISVTEDLVGLSGLTLDELRTIIAELELHEIELITWLNFRCRSPEEYDPSIPPVPDNDDYGPDGFCWHAVTTYSTLDELRKAFDIIYSHEYADFQYSWYAEEKVGFFPLPEDPTRTTDLKSYYLFKEFDGRLYTRDDYFNYQCQQVKQKLNNLTYDCDKSSLYEDLGFSGYSYQVVQVQRCVLVTQLIE